MRRPAATRAFFSFGPCFFWRDCNATGALSLNGTVEQNSDLRNIIWNVAEQIARLSEAFELKPGDIICSGTPENVGPVVKGDVLPVQARRRVGYVDPDYVRLRVIPGRALARTRNLEILRCAIAHRSSTLGVAPE